MSATIWGARRHPGQTGFLIPVTVALSGLIDPLSAVIKKINSKFNPVIEVYESAEAIIKNAILSYKRAEEQKAIEAYRAAEVLAQNNDLAGAQLQLAFAAQPTSVQAGVSTRITWSARVTDVAQIPREYLVPDMQALNALARATKGKSTIPGVEFVATESLAVRQ